MLSADECRVHQPHPAQFKTDGKMEQFNLNSCSWRKRKRGMRIKLTSSERSSRLYQTYLYMSVCFHSGNDVGPGYSKEVVYCVKHHQKRP